MKWNYQKSVRVVDKKCGGYFTKWNRTQLRSKIWNGTDLMEHSFLSCIAQKKGSRPLDYVHNVILECETVHYNCYTENINSTVCAE